MFRMCMCIIICVYLSICTYILFKLNYSDELKLSEFTDDLNHMTNNVLAIQKKVLLAIKISPNLVKRDLIGRYLSELASLTQTLGTRLNSLASSGNVLTIKRFC